MIWIFSLNKASACACDNYNDLFQYLLKNDNQFSETQVISDMGSSQLKQWCLSYCEDHNYVLIENCVKTKGVPAQAIPMYSDLPDTTLSPHYLDFKTSLEGVAS